MFHYRSWRIIVRVLDIVLDQPVVDIHLRRSFRSRGGIILVVIVSTKSILLWVFFCEFLLIFFFYREITFARFFLLEKSRRRIDRRSDGLFRISDKLSSFTFDPYFCLWYLISTTIYGGGKSEKSIWPLFHRSGRNKDRNFSIVVPYYWLINA